MRVEIDRERCQRNGRCAREAPAVFALGPDGPVAVLVEAPPDALRRGVVRAARHCPTQAIAVTRA